MHIQIEATTKCNYQCFYCAGRDMPQRHMDMELFKDILKRLPIGKHRISLQGEGEPTMHPSFWEMVEMATLAGHTPYTITNGSLMKPELILRYFPRIGISMDTADPKEAQRIKRFKLHKVMKNIENLLKIYDAHRVVIHTVNYGQNIDSLIEYLKKQGITKHVIQPLQAKDDYAYRYRDLVPAVQAECSYRCAFVETPIMRFYNLQGVEMPCCYIKDAGKYESAEKIKWSLDHRIVPSVCSGCQQLYEGNDMSKIFQTQYV